LRKSFLPDLREKLKNQGESREEKIFNKNYCSMKKAGLYSAVFLLSFMFSLRGIAQASNLTDEEQSLLKAINKVRAKPQVFAKDNKAFLTENYPEFYNRLLNAKPLEALKENCTMINYTRLKMGKGKIKDCEAAGGYTRGFSYVVNGNFNKKTEFELLMEIYFCLLEPRPKFIGLCLNRAKGLAVHMGNEAEDEGEFYFRQYQDMIDKCTPPDEYTDDIFEVGIERQLLILLNKKRKEANLKPLTVKNKSHDNFAAYVNTMLYFDKSDVHFAASNPKNILLSKADAFKAKESAYNPAGAWIAMPQTSQRVDTFAMAKKIFNYLVAHPPTLRMIMDPSAGPVGMHNFCGCTQVLYVSLVFPTGKPNAPATVSSTPAIDPDKSPEANNAMHTVNTAAIEREFIKYLNQNRKAKGLNPVAVMTGMQKAARHHSDYMALNDILDHDEDLPGFKEFYERINHYETNAGGKMVENVLYNWYSGNGLSDTTAIAKKLLQQWEDSPPHNKNLYDAQCNIAGMQIAVIRKTKKIFATYVAAKKK
jgi:uncharacterized protein YkwD